MTPRVVTTIPTRDRAFRHIVDTVKAEPGADTADELRDRLRPLYPQVAVFERQLSGEPLGFYVYRDGRLKPDPGGAWWTAPGTAHARVSMRTGKLTAVDADVATRLGCDPAQVVGRHFTEFVAPSARTIARGLFDTVVRGEIRSRVRVRQAAGGTALIEFRAVRDGGEIDVAYREIAERFEDS